METKEIKQKKSYSISNETIDIITETSKQFGGNLSTALEYLVKIGVDADAKIGIANNNTDSINRILKKIDYIENLIKQIFADLPILENMDVSLCDVLKDFDSKYYKTNIND